jgi:DNA-binding NarL/FixJ family response regulator
VLNSRCAFVKRTLRRRTRIRLLRVTASDDPRDADRAFELGAVGNIPKEQMQNTLVPALMDIGARRQHAPSPH